MYRLFPGKSELFRCLMICNLMQSAKCCCLINDPFIVSVHFDSFALYLRTTDVRILLHSIMYLYTKYNCIATDISNINPYIPSK